MRLGDWYMSTYMFGMRVTEQEALYMNNVLKGKTRLEQGKQFIATKMLAQKYNTSLQSASLILENNKQKAERLTKESNNISVSYILNKGGCVCRKTVDKLGRTIIEELPDTTIIPQKKVESTKFDKCIHMIKKGIKYIISLFEVY